LNLVNYPRLAEETFSPLLSTSVHEALPITSYRCGMAGAIVAATNRPSGRIWDFSAVPKQDIERQALPTADHSRSFDRFGIATEAAPIAERPVLA